MRSKMTHRLMMSIVAVLALAPAAFGQAPAAPRRSIEHMNGGVYRAMNNNHGTVFLVTTDGIVLGDPINADFATMAQGGVRHPLQGTGQIRHLQPPPLGPCLRRGCLRRHGPVRRPCQHALEPGDAAGVHHARAGRRAVSAGDEVRCQSQRND